LRVLDRPDSLAEFSHDSGIIELLPRAAFVATTEAEVLEAIAEARARGLSITPRGSGTSIPSQAVGRGAILLQERRGVTPEMEGLVSCEPAVVKSDLNAVLEPNGQWMPVDPSSYLSCSVGGMVSNNSSSARSYKYHSTIDWVKGLRVVLPEEGVRVIRPMSLDEALSSDGTEGRVANLLVENQKAISEERPRVTKNSSGYRLERVIHDGLFDLPRLFVGSEGTLAIVTQVSLSTIRKARSRILLVMETSLSGLDKMASALREHGPSAIELVDKSVFRQTHREDRIRPYSRTDDDYLVFCEFDGSEPDEAFKALEGASLDRRVSGFDPLTLTDPADVAKAWEVRNETLTIAAEMRNGSRYPVPGVEDLVVPPEKLGALVKLLVGAFEERGLQYISYGHAGDANLHMRPLLDPRSSADRGILDELMQECFEAVLKMGGSITGEHGDGMLRAPFVELQYRRTFSIMKKIKELYDPKGLLNPGVKIP